MAACPFDDCNLKECLIDACTSDRCTYDGGFTASFNCINGACVRHSIATFIPCAVDKCTKHCDIDGNCIDYSVANSCMSDLRLYSVGGLINKYNSSITSSDGKFYDFTTYIQNSFHNKINTSENIDNYIPKAEYIRQIDCFSISEDITDEKLVAYKDITLQCVTSTYTQCIPLS